MARHLVSAVSSVGIGSPHGPPGCGRSPTRPASPSPYAHLLCLCPAAVGKDVPKVFGPHVKERNVRSGVDLQEDVGRPFRHSLKGTDLRVLHEDLQDLQQTIANRRMAKSRRMNILSIGRH